MPRLSRLPCRVIALGVFLSLFSTLRSAEPFDYFSNSWNVIGLKDYNFGTRVTPDNRLQLAEGAHVELRCGSQLAPLGRRPIKQLLEGWLPIILLAAEDGPVRYDFTLWATPLPTVKNWEKAFDWPSEGENYMNWILVRACNRGTTPAGVKFQAVQTGRSPQTLAEATTMLAAGASAEFHACTPFLPMSAPIRLTREDAQLWLKRTQQYWTGLLANTCRIQVPCRKATEALLAAHVCQLIANDHGQLHGGEGFYDEFYIRDGAYQLMELEEAGLADAAAKAVTYYLKSQRPDGRFETQKNQFDANGQALWVLWQYFRITGDRAWLERAYPQMHKAVAWMMQARRLAPAGSPYAGLLPVAPADGEFLWDAKHHIVGYDLWNLRGLLCTLRAATVLQRPEAKELEADYAAYRKDFDAACQRTGVAHLPPSWEKDGTHWGNTETLWPVPVLAADDPRVSAMIQHARKTQGGGFIEGTIQWLGTRDAIHPYMSAYTTMASLCRGEDQQVVEDFYWYLLHSSASHAFPEGIYYRRRFAWSNTIPHVTGASNYALMLRHMLIHETEDELHLLAAVPDWWLAEGQEIRVERAPTHFGTMNLLVRGTAQGVEVRLDPPQRERPRRTVLHLPRARPLAGRLEGVTVVLRPNQKERWDFPTVVARYKEQARSLIKPIPGLVPLPLGSTLDSEKCRLLDLASLANTDPFTAPFGVANPGKLLFTGLLPGRQTVGGVPFDILDPSKNKGCALIVLHSPRAPKNRSWPREVVIPVNDRAQRLYLLGNVHGWDSQDPGTGPWGAVAEYLIHYADGQVQAVPLITGRTIDDWCLPPEATEVFVGLKGKPWHLNLLGVTLRPEQISKIVFRSLGTQAAPVLVAATLER